ncbi:hypothetical protein F2P56_022043 [Juglans regia]|uniref:Replication factor A C-terminal domain-containing protein n=1 Tax=Juglans regia TaxID=51240 RepID=A0A833X2Z7_JUGRE|nr:hypothetical protein F2P56_022043 [Juglans regia]
MQRSTFMVRGKFTISDLHQPFFYLSCAKCSKTTGYEKDEEFLCYNCKEQTTAKPRSRIYLEAFDDSGSIAVVAFEPTIERILDCTTTDIVQHIEQEDHSYVENITSKIEDKEWTIVLSASMNEFGKLRQNKFNVLSVNDIPGTTE